jgi:ceramide glucosyltransferase
MTLLGFLAFLSLALTVWQWIAARRFPLHRRLGRAEATPAVTVLKPLRGCDTETRACLESWLRQDYPGALQFLFGVESGDDPACEVVRGLQAAFPRADARLVVCPESLGPNAKVSTLAQLEPLVKHDLILVSDADVRVPPDFLVNAAAPFRDPAVGLVNPFYRLANPASTAMRWEEIAVNADFWTSVLQARAFGPMRFALGAVMIARRRRLEGIGGFKSLVNHLADDYELGRRIVRNGGEIVLCPVVVDCCEAPQGWRAVWRHQLRWSRTIRVCQPLPYALSILSNPTLWPALWAGVQPGAAAFTGVAVCLAVRLLTAADNQRRLARSWHHLPWLWLVPVKDLLQFLLWVLSFVGNRVEWRGRRFRVQRGGRLVREGECVAG